jgi:hypothetical protein
MKRSKSRKFNTITPSLIDMEKQLLIEFNCNYADEFDVEGFIVMTESEWANHQEVSKKYFDNHAGAECYFGTNESCEYSDYDDYMRAFSVTPLTVVEYRVLKKLFNEHVEGYTYEFEGVTHTIPTRDTIRNGTLAMIQSEENEEEDA